MLEAHLTLLGQDLKQQKYDDALARMKDVESRFEVSFDDIEQQEEYAGFVKSPQYAQWLEYRKAQGKPSPEPPAAGRPKAK